jgi:hypothetical protein
MYQRHICNSVSMLLRITQKKDCFGFHLSGSWKSPVALWDLSAILNVSLHSGIKPCLTTFIWPFCRYRLYEGENFNIKKTTQFLELCIGPSLELGAS